MPSKQPTPEEIAKANPPPLPVFCFKVQLEVDGFMNAEAFFKSVGGLKFETESVDVKAGGVNYTTFKLIGSTKFPNLVLKRGFAKDSKLLLWRQSWLRPEAGARPARANGKIIQLGNDMEQLCSFKFERAFPAKWEIAEYDASKSELAIETLELVHEGLTYSSSP